MHPLHLAGVSPLSIIETVQVQKAMHDVQAQFVCERISEDASVMSRGFNTDKDFAMLEGQHIGRARLMEELPMQGRHSTIRDKPNENLAQPDQVCRFPPGQPQTGSHRVRRERFELDNVDGDFPLKISYPDLRDCTIGSHLTISDLMI